jgi:putative copper resistance protein D
LTDPLVYVRAIHFAATLLAAGAVYFVVLVLPRTEAETISTTRLRKWLAVIAWCSLAVCVVSGAFWLALNARSMSGQPLVELLPQGVIGTVLWQTEFGNAWLIRFAAAVLFAAAMPVLFTPKKPPLWIETATVILATVLTGGLAWAGHAIGASGVESVAHPTADVLHLIAAAAWLGALPLLGLLLGFAARGDVSLAAARIATIRFSMLGTASVATLLVSGIVNTWYLAGSVAALTDTSYGRLLLIKIALFLGMVAVAAVNRLYVTPRLLYDDSAPTAALTLRRNALVETFGGVAILLIIAKLGTMTPANHLGLHAGAVPADAAFVHIHSGEGMADVTINPGHTGVARASVRLWDEDFNPLNAKAMTFGVAPPDAPAKATNRPAAQDADGAWHIDNIELPQQGNWTVTVDITLGSGKHVLLDAPIVIDPAQ